MTDEVIVRARQNCCRLCLAPDSECVPIMTSLAADKEPLSTKINACVNVKVIQSDRLSLRICHSCISFLNSWQSFKNRCLAAQIKQMNWLEMAKNSMRRQIGQMQQHQSEKQQQQQPPPQFQIAAGSKLSNLNKPTGRPMPCPMVIKEEPIDEEADMQERAAMRMNLDPCDYLERAGGIVPKQEVDEEESLLEPSKMMMSEGPQILTSLGLTQIRRANPYSQLRNDREPVRSTPDYSSAQCRFCHAVFSTATNARRHERNVHRGADPNTEPPKLIKPTTHRSLLKPMLPAMQSPPPLALLKSELAPPIVTPEMMGIFDYDHPEKYRHLLTDSKITFLRKHDSFLEQYQTMTCICCPQTFPSYKTFMAHMRRKYPNLARNLCFKCLKQFQSKTTFVAHLRKRNCLNLYKVYKTDSSIPKSGPLSSPEKMGAKELLNNKAYECKLCTKTFRLKLDFRSHVYEAHGDQVRKDGAAGQCGFCNVELEDPIQRRRHYNNMECIVMIRCRTCKERFDLHQQFIDHVYENHLPPPVNNNEVTNESMETLKSEAMPSPNVSYSETFNSRLPHSCNICGQTYNNYYNVLRHMEGKHPDQVPKRYICDKCNAGYSRQGALRDHMYEVHGTTLTRTRRDLFSCRMCSEQMDTKEKWMKHQTEQHSRYTCCFCTYQTKSLDEFTDHIEIHPQLANRNAPIPIANSTLLSVTNGDNEGDDDDEEEGELGNPAKKPKLETSSFECPVCHSAFSGNVALSNHMRMHYANEGIPNLSILKSTSTPNQSEPKPPSTEPHRIRCHVCSKRFTAKKSYRRHMLEEHQIRNVTFIKCGICKAEYTHERGLKIHMYKVHGAAAINEAMNASYECNICDSEFKSEKSLNQHKGMVHKNRDKNPADLVPAGPAYWYQCHSCPANFDTNKKLAIHINSHNEIDPTDYSCKDCGNVYNGRKSLWVHRYKKHPQLPDPASCDICNKLFFTGKMLESHMKVHVDKAASEATNQSTNEGDENMMMEANVDANTNDGQEDEEQEEGEDTFQDKVHCTVCNEEFTDQDLFDKHMETHQIDLYSDNPLAAMFDTGPDDPNQFFMSCRSDNGAFACDICPKSFPILTALKVHRNWHFKNEAKLVAIDPNMRSIVQKRKLNVCKFCDTSFSSASNLRRHIAEVHNRDSMNDPNRAKMFMDKYLECTKCVLKFEKKSDWVIHKLGHAKDSHSSAFEWGCEICGKIVSRKERLLHHMQSHLKIKGEDDGNGSVMSEDQSNSQDSTYSSNTGRQSAVGKLTTGDDDEHEDEQESGGKSEQAKVEKLILRKRDENSHDHHVNGDNDNEEGDRGDDEDDDDDNDEEEDRERGDNASIDDDEGMHYDEDSSQQYQEVDPDQDDEDEDGEEEEEDDDEDNIGSYSCDLCQVYFETAKQLRRHVTSHFLNGPGSVTLTEIPKDKTTYPSKMQIEEDSTSITPV